MLRIRWRLALPILLALPAVPVGAGVIGPQPFTVGSGADCAYTSVQDALNAAAVTAGAQTIRIARNRPYTTQTLTIEDAEQVTLAGGYDSCGDSSAGGYTGLVGNDLAPVVQVGGTGNVSLLGLDLSRGGGREQQGAKFGGGVFHYGEGHLVVASSLVYDNAAQFGSGIAVLGTGSLTLSDAIVRNNRLGAAPVAPGDAGVYFFSSAGTLTLIGATVQQNEAGGVHVARAAGTQVVLSQILDNDAAGRTGHGLTFYGAGPVYLEGTAVRDHDGGGLYFGGDGAMTLSSSTISSNTAADGAGLQLAGTGAVTLSGCVVSGNSAGVDGGGILHDGRGALRIEASTVEGNSAVCRGGGIRVDADSGTLSIERGSAIRGNAAARGGGLHHGGSGLLILDAATVSANRADGDGGGVLHDGTGGLRIDASTVEGNTAVGRGGGIHIDADSGTLSIERGSAIRGNAAARGGGIHHAGSAPLTLDAATVSGNESSYGSGIAVEGAGSLRLSASTITANLPGSQIGPPSIAGLYFASAGSLDIRQGSSIQGNAGSGVYVERAGLTEIRDSVLADNDLGGEGPNLVLLESAVSLLDHVELRDDRDGGLVHGGSGSLLLDTCIIERNGPQPDVDAANHRSGGLDLSGSGVVTVKDSRIDANIGQGSSGLVAGGIGYRGTGRLEIVGSTISGNSGEQGGGIGAAGPVDGPWPVLWIGPDTRIVDNRALTGYGGGLALFRIDLDLSTAPRHEIARNTAARGGGGLYLNGGRARIGSGVVAGNIRANRLDTSGDGGGGLLVNGGAEVYLFTTDPNAPVALRGNVAEGGSGMGGALVVSGLNAAPGAPATRVYGYDLAIEGNIADFGAGVAVSSGKTAEGAVAATFCLGRALQPDSCADLGGSLPASARACTAGIDCNVLNSNTSRGVFGAAALLRATTGDAATTVRVVGAQFGDNRGRSLLSALGLQGPFYPPPPGAFEIRDSVLLGNDVSDTLIGGIPPGFGGIPAEASHALGRVEIERSTVGCNVIGAPWVSATRIDLRLIESIVHQPGVAVHAGNPSGVFARHVLANEVATLPVRVDVVAGDPRFAFDDGVECDPHLGPLSPAVDFSNYATGGVDLEGNARGQDRADVLDRFGPRDLGALEREGSSAPPPSEVFADGFEGVN